MTRTNRIGIALLLSGVCAASDLSLKPGLIATDAGGAVGYQHALKQSHFAMGKESRAVAESGWSKQIGPEGAFAVSLHNGVAVAIPNAHSPQAQTTEYILDPERHSKEVFNYFVAAGIPRDQIAGVHAVTRLSSSGRRGEAHAALPKVESYVSVLERKIGDYPVPDSVAWAQLDKNGNVISEGVYWPAIPGRALQDARRMKEVLARKSDRTKFLAQLPSQLPPGRIAIRHSSPAMQQGDFEAIASYDVVERRTAVALGESPQAEAASQGVTVVRHFDLEGKEKRLPQERRNAEKEYPTPIKLPPPSTKPPQKSASEGPASQQE
jgi:hypothetical protein